MKKLIVILLCLIFAMCSKAQKIEDLKVDTSKIKEIDSLNKLLQGKKWETIQEKETSENFMLIPFKLRKFAGVITTFSTKKMFVQKNVAPCGNDLFWIKHGKYKLLSNNTIAMQTDSIRYRGMVKKPTEYLNELSMYIVTKKDSTFTFLKQ